MGSSQRRDRLVTIQELLDTQRKSVPPRCAHCGHDRTDPDHELVLEALRTRIRVLETAWQLETQLVGVKA